VSILPFPQRQRPEGSLTVTVKVQEAVRPELSMAVAATVVVPKGKLNPETGLYTTEEIPQFTKAAQTGAETVMGAIVGQVIVGF
jgi:hypothetical protein